MITLFFGGIDLKKMLNDAIVISKKNNGIEKLRIKKLL
jgi:hypothetical protein